MIPTPLTPLPSLQSKNPAVQLRQGSDDDPVSVSPVNPPDLVDARLSTDPSDSMPCLKEPPDPELTLPFDPANLVSPDPSDLAPYQKAPDLSDPMAPKPPDLPEPIDIKPPKEPLKPLDITDIMLPTHSDPPDVPGLMLPQKLPEPPDPVDLELFMDPPDCVNLTSPLKPADSINLDPLDSPLHQKSLDLPDVTFRSA